MLQGNEKGISILPLKPLFCFQRCLWASCVGVQVILEEVRLQGEMSGSGALGLEGSSGLHTVPAASWAHLSRDCHDDGLTFPLMKLEEPFKNRIIIIIMKKRCDLEGGQLTRHAEEASVLLLMHSSVLRSRGNPKESQQGCARAEPL